MLGELFYGTWPDRDGRGETELIVEQVSHHPPIVSLLVFDPVVRLTRGSRLFSFALDCLVSFKATSRGHC